MIDDADYNQAMHEARETLKQATDVLDRFDLPKREREKISNSLMRKAIQLRRNAMIFSPPIIG